MIMNKEDISELHSALMSAQDLTYEEANELVGEMVNRVHNGCNAEDLLFEQGLEPDYVFDLINLTL